MTGRPLIVLLMALLPISAAVGQQRYGALLVGAQASGSNAGGSSLPPGSLTIAVGTATSLSRVELRAEASFHNNTRSHGPLSLIGSAVFLLTSGGPVQPYVLVGAGGAGVGGVSAGFATSVGAGVRARSSRAPIGGALELRASSFAPTVLGIGLTVRL